MGCAAAARNSVAVYDVEAVVDPVGACWVAREVLDFCLVEAA